LRGPVSRLMADPGMSRHIAACLRIFCREYGITYRSVAQFFHSAHHYPSSSVRASRCRPNLSQSQLDDELAYNLSLLEDEAPNCISFVRSYGTSTLNPRANIFHPRPCIPVAVAPLLPATEKDIEYGGISVTKQVTVKDAKISVYDCLFPDSGVPSAESSEQRVPLFRFNADAIVFHHQCKRPSQQCNMNMEPAQILAQDLGHTLSCNNLGLPAYENDLGQTLSCDNLDQSSDTKDLGQTLSCSNLDLSSDEKDLGQTLSCDNLDQSADTKDLGQTLSCSNLDLSSDEKDLGQTLSCDNLCQSPHEDDLGQPVSCDNLDQSSDEKDLDRTLACNILGHSSDEKGLGQTLSCDNLGQDDLESNSLDPSSTLLACEVQKKKKRKNKNKNKTEDIQMRCAKTTEQPMRKVYPPPDIEYECCEMCKFRTYETDLYWRPAQAYGYKCLCQSCYYEVLAKSEKDKEPSSELCIGTAHGRLTLSAVYSQVQQFRSFLDDPSIANPDVEAHDAQVNEWMSRKMHELFQPLIPKIEIIRNVLSRLLQKRGGTDAAINEDLITLRDMHKKFEAVKSDMYRTIHDHQVNGNPA